MGRERPFIQCRWLPGEARMCHAEAQNLSVNGVRSLPVSLCHHFTPRVPQRCSDGCQAGGTGWHGDAVGASGCWRQQDGTHQRHKAPRIRHKAARFPEVSAPRPTPVHATTGPDPAASAHALTLRSEWKLNGPPPCRPTSSSPNRSARCYLPANQRAQGAGRR